MQEVSFRPSALLSEADVPDCPGVYFIKLIGSSGIAELDSEIRRRSTSLLYIGKASVSLRKRLWQEELRARRPATFFRSIGAILGYLPPKGSLAGKRSNNFKFFPADQKAICRWIESHTETGWLEGPAWLTEEVRLIRSHRPPINIDHNPDKWQHLKEMRTRCLSLAKNS